MTSREHYGLFLGGAAVRFVKRHSRDQRIPGRVGRFCITTGSSRLLGFQDLVTFLIHKRDWLQDCVPLCQVSSAA
jgi:hypothetical protein